MASTDDSTVPTKEERERAEIKRKRDLRLPDNPLDDFWKRS